MNSVSHPPRPVCPIRPIYLHGRDLGQQLSQIAPMQPKMGDVGGEGCGRGGVWRRAGGAGRGRGWLDDGDAVAQDFVLALGIVGCGAVGRVRAVADDRTGRRVLHDVALANLIGAIGPGAMWRER